MLSPLKNIDKHHFLYKNSGQFELSNIAKYRRWREEKLENYPQQTADLMVEIGGLAKLDTNEREAINDRCRCANMVIYKCRNTDVSPELIRKFAANLGLLHLDYHLCADETGVTALRVTHGGNRKPYIPYTNSRLSWHTDGYYNSTENKIRAVLLHCANTATSGGENEIIDHELVYMYLRDQNPDFIKALMHPECLTIPANKHEDTTIRPALSGPVFSVDPKTGDLHMRYTRRKHNVIWRNDEMTRTAVNVLDEYLADNSNPIFKLRLEAGQGLLSNNILHNRSAFIDDPKDGRLVYRARFKDRIGL